MKKFLSVCVAAAMIISCAGIALTASAVEVTEEATQAVTEQELTQASVEYEESGKSHSYNGIIYRITLKGEIHITGYIGDSPTVNIPDQIDSKPVTSIAALAFKNQTGLKSIALPYSIREINTGAFENCSSLSSLPDITK